MFGVGVQSLMQLNIKKNPIKILRTISIHLFLFNLLFLDEKNNEITKSSSFSCLSDNSIDVGVYGVFFSFCIYISTYVCVMVFLFYTSSSSSSICDRVQATMCACGCLLVCVSFCERVGEVFTLRQLNIAVKYNHIVVSITIFGLSEWTWYLRAQLTPSIDIRTTKKLFATHLIKFDKKMLAICTKSRFSVFRIEINSKKQCDEFLKLFFCWNKSNPFIFWIITLIDRRFLGIFSIDIVFFSLFFLNGRKKNISQRISFVSASIVNLNFSFRYRLWYSIWRRKKNQHYAITLGVWEIAESVSDTSSERECYTFLFACTHGIDICIYI